jgi:hypothetical protein
MYVKGRDKPMKKVLDLTQFATDSKNEDLDEILYSEISIIEHNAPLWATDLQGMTAEEVALLGIDLHSDWLIDEDKFVRLTKDEYYDLLQKLLTKFQ